jgi:hypothetical protein
LDNDMTLAPLLDRIAGLGDDAALEAANLLAGDILGVASDTEVADKLSAALDTNRARIESAVEAATPHEAAELARSVLTIAAVSGHADEVAGALDAAGEKAVLLEIALIGLLALGVLHTVLTRGAKSKTTDTTVTLGADGSVTVHTTEKTENYKVGEAIAPLAEKLLKPS